MSTFQVRVERVTIAPHHNADALELAQIGAYDSVVRKGQLVTGDLVAYIPEQALVPVPLLVELGLEGRLAGKQKNRVKAVRLRGVLSQGICMTARAGWTEGQDVTEELGIVKYEPPIPASMSGAVWAAGLDRTLRYDIENLKRHPDAFDPGEPVVLTEKLHGTWTQLGWMPAAMAHPEHGRLVVSSKGLAARGLVFQPFAEDNATNLYLRVARHLGVGERVTEAFGADYAEPVFILGEVFGRGVQDLAYGASTAQDAQLGFRAFDIYVGLPGQGAYLDDAALDSALERLGLSRVPIIARVPFSEAAVTAHTSGRESVTGRGVHLREGIVIRPVVERRHVEVGRLQLKSVSAKYLLRKNATEYN